MKHSLTNIHPELQAMAQRIPAMSFNRTTVWLMRAMLLLRRASPRGDDALVNQVLIPGANGTAGVRVRCYQPRASAAPTPVLLWLHGGGYVMGSPKMDDARCLDYVRLLGITLVSVAYRYAPAHPFPAALEDAYAALKWAQGLALHGRVAIGGASAGGGLAAALAQLAYDRQEVPVAGQLLVYPMLDDRTLTRTDLGDTQHLVWNQKSNRFGWRSYLGRHGGGVDAPAYAVAARRASLLGLAPAWLGVGTEDLFYDEGRAYAARLQAEGVDCVTDLVQGAFHGFDAFDPQLPLVQAFRQGQVAALRRWLWPS